LGIGGIMNYELNLEFGITDRRLGIGNWELRIILSTLQTLQTL